MVFKEVVSMSLKLCLYLNWLH